MKRLIRKASIVYLKDIIDENDLNTYGYCTDYGNRDKAIMYIDGEIYEDVTHKDALENYLNGNELDEDILDSSEGFVTEQEQSDLDLPMGIASYIKGTDGNDYIAIYPDSLFNLDIDKFISDLRKEYHNAIICIDNNDRYDYCENKDAYIETT